MDTKIDIESEHRPLLGSISRPIHKPNINDIKRNLSYPIRFLLVFVFITPLFLLLWFFGWVFGFDQTEFYEISVKDWSIIFAILFGSYILISLFVKLVLDLISYFGRDKFGYQVRLTYRCSRMIVLAAFFIIVILVHDKYFTVPCDGEDPESHSQCHLIYLREFLLCSITTILGLIIVKWVVMGISLKYQDKVYRDRIILNRYHLYIANTLFESCKDEGIKQGLDLSQLNESEGGNKNKKAPRVSFLTVSSSESDEYDEDYALENSHGSTTGSMGLSLGESQSRPTTFIARTISLFKRAYQGKNINKKHRTPTITSASVTQTGHVKLYHLLDFSNFKKGIKVFKSDFSLVESEHEDLKPEEARKRAKFIFEVLLSLSEGNGHLLPSSSASAANGLVDRDFVTQNEFIKLLKIKSSAIEAYQIFDINFDGKLTKSEFKQSFTHIYREHHNILESVLSAAEALRALDTTLSILLFIILALLYCIIFGLNIQGILTLALSMILGLNVIIGNFARDMFDCLVFLFVTHPFDIGDRIKIEGDSRVYTVKQIYVLRTLLIDPKGEEITMPNPLLIHKGISNLRRSQEQWETVELYLDMSVTEKQLNEFRSNLTNFLHINATYFYSKFELEAIPPSSNVNDPVYIDVYALRLRVQCKPTLGSNRVAERHREILTHVKSDIERIGISYYPKGPDGPRMVPVSRST